MIKNTKEMDRMAQAVIDALGIEVPKVGPATKMALNEEYKKLTKDITEKSGIPADFKSSVHSWMLEAKREVFEPTKMVIDKFIEKTKNIHYHGQPAKKVCILNFKSTPDNFLKEKLGFKNNTVIKIDPDDGRFIILKKFYDELDIFKLVSDFKLEEMPLKIDEQLFSRINVNIINTETGESFIRNLKDVTKFDDYYILSW